MIVRIKRIKYEISDIGKNKIYSPIADLPEIIYNPKVGYCLSHLSLYVNRLHKQGHFIAIDTRYYNPKKDIYKASLDRLFTINKVLHDLFKSQQCYIITI